MEQNGDLPAVPDGAVSPFKLVRPESEALPNLEKTPNLREFGAKEFRFRAPNIIKDIEGGDWLVFKHYNTIVGAIVSNDDLEFLFRLAQADDTFDLCYAFDKWQRSSPNGPILCHLSTVNDDLKFTARLRSASDVRGVLAALESWDGCGPDAPAALALHGMLAEAQRGAPALADFPKCIPSNGPDGDIRAIEFGGGDHVTAGQLAIMGSNEGHLYLHGFIERADIGATLVLELPNGQAIDTFEEDGSVLYLRRTLLNSPIALMDIRIRPISKNTEPLLLG